MPRPLQRADQLVYQALLMAAGVSLNIPEPITETALDSSDTVSLEILARLAMHGVTMSIDDFGTGYANLERLDRMPFGELKIDHTFVARALEDEHTRIIVENSVELAHRLGLSVVIEGVSSETAWSWARRTGSELAQGFFIARPMPLDDLAEKVASGEAF